MHTSFRWLHKTWIDRKIKIHLIKPCKKSQFKEMYLNATLNLCSIHKAPCSVLADDNR